VHVFQAKHNRYPGPGDNEEILSIAKAVNEQAKTDGTETVEDIDEKVLLNTSIYSTSSICA